MFDEFGVAALPAFAPVTPVCEVAGVLGPLGALEGIAVDGLALEDEEARCRACDEAGTLA